MSVVFSLSNIAQIKEKIKFVYTRKDGMLCPHTIPKKTLNFYVLKYFNTVCIAHCLKINLHNQLYMYKTCSFDISKSPTYFST